MLRVSRFDALQAPTAPGIFSRVSEHREDDVGNADANQNADDG
ncbi:hypothetical protein [Mesorhizobium huakuii]|nr:hypothetical protein [Mesorhizobium huakuii]